MKKADKKLEYLLKNAEGRVLGIGLSKQVVSMLEKNKQIVYCDLLNSFEKKVKTKGKKEKLFYIKDLRKKYKKNNLDLIIVNYDEVKKYIKTFIRDSVYICKGHIYIYNADESINKYLRYNAKISRDELIAIDVSNAKTNFIKDKIYYVVDTTETLIDYISDFLTM